MKKQFSSKSPKNKTMFIILGRAYLFNLIVCIKLSFIFQAFNLIISWQKTKVNTYKFYYIFHVSFPSLVLFFRHKKYMKYSSKH